MKRLNKTALALAAASVLGSGVAQAALFDRGGGLIYDDVLKITWLSDANYAKTKGDDGDGLMNWSAAKAWADGLIYGGYDNWRLPTALNQDGSGPCYGYNCTESEMGHMFYNNLGASKGNSILSGSNTANLALFTNLQSYFYWSGTAWEPKPAYGAWYFHNLGFQGGNAYYVEFYAWAVHPGDIGAVPEPEAYALLMAGLGLLGVVAKRRRRLFGAS